MSKKIAFFLFSSAHPGGFMFNETSEERARLVDTPEWFEHPSEVPLPPDAPYPSPYGHKDGIVSIQTATLDSTEPRYSLAEILNSSVSLFTITQLAGEVGKHGLVLIPAPAPATTTAPAQQQPPRQETNVVYDNEAVAAMILRGNTEPLKHEHFVTLAKALGVKHHKVKQTDLIVQLKAVIEGAAPTQGQSSDDDEVEEEADDEVVLGIDGKPVAPLKPNTD